MSPNKETKSDWTGHFGNDKPELSFCEFIGQIFSFSDTFKQLDPSASSDIEHRLLGESY